MDVARPARFAKVAHELLYSVVHFAADHQRQIRLALRANRRARPEQATEVLAPVEPAEGEDETRLEAVACEDGSCIALRERTKFSPTSGQITLIR